MELTKEQIQYIDHRLENDGVKYWDIRIEMLDHVVSDVEKNLKPEHTKYEFNEIVQEAFVSLGWKENFNGSSFEQVLKENFKIIIKKNRKVFHNEFKLFFKSNKQIVFFFLLIVLYSLLSTITTHKHFVIISYIFFYIPVIIFFYESIKLWQKKLGKSSYKENSLTFLFMSFALFNVFMLGMKPEGEDFAFPIEYQKNILIILLPAHLFLSYIGYKTYKKLIVNVEKMRNQLLS